MSGAGCSRVTHPFAARVPRRAFPLDLHVLSTPPAFVLSQDQTLQQKPVEKQTPAKILTKGNCQRKNTLGTGLSSTLLSSQRTTTHRIQGLIKDHVFRATGVTYLVDFAAARLDILLASPKCFHEKPHPQMGTS